MLITSLVFDIGSMELLDKINNIDFQIANRIMDAHRLRNRVDLRQVRKWN